MCHTYYIYKCALILFQPRSSPNILQPLSHTHNTHTHTHTLRGDGDAARRVLGMLPGCVKKLKLKHLNYKFTPFDFIKDLLDSITMVLYDSRGVIRADRHHSI